MTNERDSDFDESHQTKLPEDESTSKTKDSTDNRLETGMADTDEKYSTGSVDGYQSFALVSNTNAEADALFVEQGTVIGVRYQLEAMIGQGGMGMVWQSTQQVPAKRRVAVKLIKASVISKQILTGFDAERQALAVMDHPHIATIFDGGLTAAGFPYFVMELVEGNKITRHCDSLGLSIYQRIELFITVCKAIHHAHQKGIIHRDIKPSNVMNRPQRDLAMRPMVPSCPRQMARNCIPGITSSPTSTKSPDSVLAELAFC